MLEVSDSTKSKYKEQSIKKNLVLTFPEINVTLTNEDVIAESLVLKESIQSGNELDYIGCNASVFEIEIVSSAYELVGKKIVVTIQAENTDEVIPLFSGYVDSAKKQNAYAITKKLIAYDPLAKVMQMDCTDWYLGLTFPIRVIDFRTQFWQHVGLPQEDTKLINDFIWLQQGLDGKTKISGKTIIESICQFNACFGLFNRTGTFTYQYLNDIYEGLYPADDLYPDDALYPSSENPDSESYDLVHMESVFYEDYTTKCIDHVYLLEKDGYIAGEYGTGSNAFIISNNFLAFGITDSEAQEAAQKIYLKIFEIDYVPCDLTLTGCPWVEVSDVLVFRGVNDVFRTYVLSRKLNGIQCLTDTIETNGSEYRDSDLDSIETKLNALSSDISAETDRATSAESTLTRNLGTEINNRVEAVNGCYSQITQTATQIRTEVAAGDNSVRSEFTQKANSIEASVQSVSGSVASLELRVNDQGGSIANLSADVVNLNGTVNNLNGSVTNINSSVTNINSRVTNLQNVVATKVSAGDIETTNLNGIKVKGYTFVPATIVDAYGKKHTVLMTVE